MKKGSTSLSIVIDPDFKAHWKEGLSNEEYHADKTTVSSTGLKEFKKSPHAFLSHHLWADEFDKEKKHLRIGRAVHMAILEPELFKKKFVLSPKFSGTGAVKAKSEWRLSIDSDALILSEDDYHDLQSMVESALKHPSACVALRAGKAEISGYFSDPLTGIKCRIRPDFFNESKMCLVDIKTTKDSVGMKDFSKTIASFEYHVQLAMYCEGVRLITGKEVELPVFLAIQTKSPFECAVYTADVKMQELGFSRYQKYMRSLKACLTNNNWPRIQSYAKDISLPDWYIKEEESV